MNILYGVPGEGMGHATRSKVVIDHLLQKHNVQVVSSSRAFQFLSKNFPGRVHEIKGFHFAYKNARVSKMGTFMLNLKSAPGNFLHNFSQYLSIQKQFTPEIVITDFESFSYYYAKHHNIPIVSIDNMQVLNRCKLEIEIPSSEKKNFVLAKSIVKAKVPYCDHYFISTFFEAETRKKSCSIVPPIIRNAILQAKATIGKHVLVYQSSGTSALIRQALHTIPNVTFFVYGFNKNETDKNITFKTFSEDGFVNDLATAKAVIANGGFSFLTEAVYLKKPVYSFPIEDQFEQFLNAAYIEKLGYGRHFSTIHADHLKAFLYDLELFQENLSNYKQEGNTVLFTLLDKELKRIT